MLDFLRNLLDALLGWLWDLLSTLLGWVVSVLQSFLNAIGLGGIIESANNAFSSIGSTFDQYAGNYGGYVLRVFPVSFIAVCAGFVLLLSLCAFLYNLVIKVVRG